MGSVESYPTSAGRRYRVRYRTPDHRQTDRRGFVTKRDAEMFLASVEVAKARGEYVNAGDARIALGDLGEVWLTQQTHLKPSSLRPLLIAWRVHVQPRWGAVRLSEVRHSDVQAWVSELSAARGATTVLRAYGVLAGVLDVAVKDRRVQSNPARGVNLPRKVRKEHRYLTHEQVHSLAGVSGEHRTLVLLLAYTGLRWGEAIGLRVGDVDLQRRRIAVSVNAVEVGPEIRLGTPKSHKRRSVPFPRLLETALREQTVGRGDDELVFAAADGLHMRRVRVSSGSRSWFKTALKEAGLDPMTLHDLRHTAASLSVSAGANVKAVQRMLGHASAAMTLDIYADLFDDDLDVVSDRLDEAYMRSSVGKVWAEPSSAVPQTGQ
ncbi:tyrosine-type recombinase/integrase [Amnibacterium setariae]|uniref:Site-specific integrase n=1 Tax=Amnibacterium setariae TaxID=2306585 RepID=A0A3A1U403_9MICO|nr:site-specific integrase [Amnibacterium setariae]